MVAINLSIQHPHFHTIISRYIVLSFFIFFISCTCFSPLYAQGGGIEINITTDQDHEPSGSIIFTLTNVTSYPIEILIWNTPFEGFFANKSFLIYRDGKPVEYTGRLIKRGKPKPSDYMLLEAGSSVSTSLSLADGYDISVPGNYEVTYSGVIQYRILDPAKGDSSKNGKIRSNRKSSNKLLLEVTSPPKPQAFYKQPPLVTGCEASRVTVLDEALTAAETLAFESYNTLATTDSGKRENAARYRAWFGGYSSQNYVKVLSNFDVISTTLANETIEFVCDCTEENWYAYVYTNDPYRIHVCNLFWDAAVIGTDSQAGTIIHELSHFIVVADTNDHVYGQQGSFELAQTNQVDALTNADNYNYFSENMPYLPMQTWYELRDDFADTTQAKQIRVYSISTNNAADKEPGEPAHAGNGGGASLWLDWESPASGTVAVSTLGSYIDTLLAVYRGDSVDALTTVAFNDDYDASSGISSSLLIFDADAGQRYHMAVDGYGGSKGLVYLTVLTDFGDLDSSGDIGLTDCILGLQLLSGKQDIADVSIYADINGNNIIGLEEVLFVIRYMANQSL